MTTKLAFVCVGNAGRSQMAAAFAERERDQRNIDIDIVTGGTDPADRIHETVIEVLQEEGIDSSDRTPRKISSDDIRNADYVVTMGCSIDQFRPENWNGEADTWELPHPEGDDIEPTRTQRDEIKRRVSEFFDQLPT